MVDDFGVKCVGKQHTKHLIEFLKENYEISEDWEGSEYWGLKLDWDYTKKKFHLYMKGYVENSLQIFKKIPSKASTPTISAYGSKVWG